MIQLSPCLSLFLCLRVAATQSDSPTFHSDNGIFPHDTSGLVLSLMRGYSGPTPATATLSAHVLGTRMDVKLVLPNVSIVIE